MHSRPFLFHTMLFDKIQNYESELNEKWNKKLINFISRIRLL